MAAKEDLKLLGVDVSPFVIRVRRGEPQQQERAAPQLQPGTQEGAGAHPQWQAHLRVPRHRAVHRRVLRRCWRSVHRPHKPVRACRCSLLGCVYRRQGTQVFFLCSVAAYQSTKLQCGGVLHSCLQFFPALAGIVLLPTEHERAQKMKETLSAIGPLEEAFAICSKGKAFFGGDSIGYLDIALGSLLIWIEAIGRMCSLEIISSSKTPLLSAWAERFGESAAAKTVVPEVEKAVQYGKKLQAAAAASASK
jgi:glutathione S-transferase